jgi:ketosteroid isomerase-like protein
MSALDVLEKLHRALEAGETGEQLRAYWDDSVVTTEYPNLIVPTGGTHDLAEMKAGSERGKGLLASQKYDVFEAHDLGDLAIVRLTWTGVVAAAVGPFEAGKVLTAHIAQFVRTHDDRITSIATYDCYEPF